MFIHITHGDNESFLANTDCPVLLLLSHLRSKVGVPPNEVIDLCDNLGSPKMLFQVKTVQDRASDFLEAHGTYYVCRVEFGAPGTAQEQTAQSFVPLLKNPSVALTGGCGDGNAWGGGTSLGLLLNPHREPPRGGVGGSPPAGSCAPGVGEETDPGPDGCRRGAAAGTGRRDARRGSEEGWGG
uniref:Chromosome X open reading frame 65 n=1 Tax=Coturnix japonica TaxID=93934 RepID=A0A8C2TQM3_COTJA